MPSAVSFIWGGDLGGQWYCRRPDVGYAIFEPMAAFRADFFIASGDMIYADVDCPAQGPGGWINIPGDFPAITDSAVDWRNADQVREVYASHWRYNRQDRAFQELLRTTPIYAQWDDHEVVNDFGARWQAYPPTPDRLGYAGIVAAGRKALFDFNPIDRHPGEPDRIYRSFRWGRDLELFIVDAPIGARTRSPTIPTARRPCLGAEQLSWLKASHWSVRPPPGRWSASTFHWRSPREVPPADAVAIPGRTARDQLHVGHRLRARAARLAQPRLTEATHGMSYSSRPTSTLQLNCATSWIWTATVTCSSSMSWLPVH